MPVTTFWDLSPWEELQPQFDFDQKTDIELEFNTEAEALEFARFVRNLTETLVKSTLNPVPCQIWEATRSAITTAYALTLSDSNKLMWKANHKSAADPAPAYMDPPVEGTYKVIIIDSSGKRCIHTVSDDSISGVLSECASGECGDTQEIKP